MEMPYWKMPGEQIIDKLGTNPVKGLSGKELLRRQKFYGKNIIPEKGHRTMFDLFISQFNNAFILILFVASIIAFFLGEITDAVTIIAILLLSSLLGFYQEYKSENALKELKRYISRRTLVIRDGTETDINAADLVPGDIILLHIGNIVPADIRLLKTEDLKTDESSITGESREVEKNASVLDKNNPSVHELSNYALMGTTISYGYARGIVIATGTETYFGKTATLLGAKIPESEFQIGLKNFSSMILNVIIVFTLIVFASNVFLNRGLLESLLFALAVAVGIAPEILPIITTVSLSNGALDMARKKVVVKKLATIEDIGNMDILCMDKTGTLTEPGMVLEGINTEGKKAENDTLLYSILCNDAHVKGKKMAGNIFDVAIMNYAHGKNEIGESGKYERVDDIEFDFERKRMGVVVKKDDALMLITKGEPESVLSVCSGTKSQKDINSKKVRGFAEQGYSVLAIATKEVKKKNDYTKEDEANLVLQGFLLFKSIPSKTATKSIAELRELGVLPYLLTGDDPSVTEKLCKDVKLEINGGQIITGKDIEKMDDEKLCETVNKYNVFARVAPAQKVKIIEALRKNGHIVGFLGDGVNDAPALRLADVGISVNTALDVAREAADIILLNKSLEVIAEGVKGGRKTFGNITKYVLNTISANYGNMFTIVIASFFLPFIPLLPSQILLNNFISDIPLLTISTDNVDEDFIKKPKRWNVKLISHFMIYFGLISTIFDIITIGVFLYIFGVSVALFRTLWFLESSLSEIFVTFIIRTKLPFYRSMPSRLLITSSLFVAIFCVIIVSLPVIGNYFEFVPPSPEQLAIAGGIVLGYCLVTEAVKHFFFKHYPEFSLHY